MTRALVTQLVEALNDIYLHGDTHLSVKKIITAAREYLATEQKPTLKEALTQQGIKLRTEFEPKQRDSELATEPSGERAELIAELRSTANHLSRYDTPGFPMNPFAAVCHQAADMLEADVRPSSPCIAICSTSQGDDLCKGCGRTFEEVCLWLEMTDANKEAVWQRIESEQTAWRFNKYSERVL